MKRFLKFFILTIVFLSSLVSIGVFAYKNIPDNIADLIDIAKKAETEQKTVVAVVEGIEIYQETIDFLATGKKIALKNSVQHNNEELVIEDIDTDEILQEQIRDVVVLAEAKKQGLEASEKEAEDYTIENYKIVKEVGGETYQILVDYMTEMDLTEKEYLKICTSVNQNKLTRANLYENFVKEKKGTYDELVAEYEVYVAKLIENADIEYK